MLIPSLRTARSIARAFLAAPSRADEPYASTDAHPTPVSPGECVHAWLPVSFRFEVQLLDSDGRVLARQPDPAEGLVYLVCVTCSSHTYLPTSWVGYRLQGSSDDLPEEVMPNAAP